MNVKEQVINALIESFVNFSKALENDQLDSNSDKVVQSLLNIYNSETLSRAYPEISQKVYMLKQDDFDYLKKFMGMTGDTDNHFSGIWQESKEFTVPSKIKNLSRLERHIQLSCYQREYITKTTNEAEEISRRVAEESRKTEEESKRAVTNSKKAAEESKRAMTNSKKAQKKVKGIYSEFVGILGIFTAMSFAMMGSVEIIGNLFSDIKMLSVASVGYALIIGGIYLIILYLIILMLFIGIKKLYGDEEYEIDQKFKKLLFRIAGSFIIIGIALLAAFHFLWH